MDNNQNRNRNDRHDRSDRNDRRSNNSRQDRPKKEAILDLKKYYDQKVVVKFIGGRQVVGVLKGYDQLMNLVLEQVVEQLRDPEDESMLTEKTRELGTVIVRGPQMLTISPLAGTEEISNPFAVEQSV
ncbi:U6 snRNA-associated Sm-like protein LSm7 domain protein [Clavispora lusitaniae]|uniref:U6 snRNA-associated Sm-like protein LSm7 domain protein n=1 Tax=Clavispora lusitaniae TaxID=36911 RepID=UPI00202BD4B9|nr:U6 snRNA-associated Sm-like protein LSm7 domain protein [Clavispora lusitaniae]